MLYDQFFSENLAILDNAIVDESYSVPLVSVRMSIAVGLGSMCGPPGVSNPNGTSMLGLHLSCQLLEAVTAKPHFLSVFRYH
jgi:hypothetical protein